VPDAADSRILGEVLKFGTPQVILPAPTLTGLSTPLGRRLFVAVITPSRSPTVASNVAYVYNAIREAALLPHGD
jgi:hypothetical protein